MPVMFETTEAMSSSPITGTFFSCVSFQSLWMPSSISLRRSSSSWMDSTRT